MRKPRLFSFASLIVIGVSGLSAAPVQGNGNEWTEVPEFDFEGLYLDVWTYGPDGDGVSGFMNIGVRENQSCIDLDVVGSGRDFTVTISASKGDSTVAEIISCLNPPLILVPSTDEPVSFTPVSAGSWGRFPVGINAQDFGQGAFACLDIGINPVGTPNNVAAGVVPVPPGADPGMVLAVRPPESASFESVSIDDADGFLAYFVIPAGATGSDLFGGTMQFMVEDCEGQSSRPLFEFALPRVAEELPDTL